IKGDPFSLTNIPLTLSIYLNPANVRFKPHFPWAFLMPADTATHLRLIAAYPNSHYDGIEPVASLTASMPILFLGALSGLPFAVRVSDGRRAIVFLPCAVDWNARRHLPHSGMGLSVATLPA